MAFQSPYVYIVTRYIQGTRQNPAIFIWPNVCRKYLRDCWTVNGTLCLPPSGELILTRHKINPKPGQDLGADYLNVEKFLASG